LELARRPVIGMNTARRQGRGGGGRGSLTRSGCDGDSADRMSEGKAMNANVGGWLDF